jgi:hypothetical protein
MMGGYNRVRFQAVTVASMKMAVFWVVAPCNLVEVHRRFRGAWCLHHQGDDDPDGGGSKQLLPDYTAEEPRRQPSSGCNKVYKCVEHLLYVIIVKIICNGELALLW